MSNLQNIYKDRIAPSALVENQGAKILIYGAAGSGKTTACATAPGKVLMISMESGLLSSYETVKMLMLSKLKKHKKSWKYMTP